MDAVLWLIVIISGMVVLFFAWFFLGAFLKLLLLWLPSLSVVAAAAGFGIIFGGAMAAVIILTGLGIAYAIYEKWEYSDLYIRMEKKISSIFNVE